MWEIIRIGTIILCGIGTYKRKLLFKAEFTRCSENSEAKKIKKFDITTPIQGLLTPIKFGGKINSKKKGVVLRISNK